MNKRDQGAREREERTMKRWKKTGTRVLERKAPEFMATIFGSVPPRQLWGWAVWYSGGAREGVDFSLKSARRKANAAIDNLPENSK